MPVRVTEEPLMPRGGTRLKRLTLAGFKTFARRGEIVFDRGITAVVGPNGSGKSNIVDAVRWALGETNARELRGARMDEVIYSGGTKKGRMGFAEVELVLDNEDGRIPIEGVEVAVGRRVTRNGDSEYRLNGDRVRLRDIERTLGSTGLTQSGYSVVAQNDIDGIIQATPSQRRALVEQAAGVRALRAASEDALDKIGKAGITLRRLDDLLEDAEPRLAELAEQAELALEQRELTERLAELRGNLAREEWRAARGHLKQARRRLDAALARAVAATEAEAGFTARFETQRDAVTLARENHRNAAARLEAARLAAERAAGEARRWLDRQTAATLQRAAIRAEVTTIGTDLSAANAVLAELAGSGADVQAGASDAEAALSRARETHQLALSGVTEADAAVATAQAAHQEAERQWQRAAGAQRDAVARLEVLNEAIAARVGEATAVRDRVATLEAEQTQAASRGTSAQARLAESEAESRAAQDQVSELRTRLHTAEAHLTQVREVAQATTARAATLRGQVDGALGGRGAIADAVQQGALAATRLVDCFQVADNSDAAAIEAALEAYLGAWLVDDLDSAAGLLEGDGGREEVLLANPVGLPSGPAPAGARRALSAITLLRDGARGPVDHILGDVWLVGDLAAARRVVADMGGRAILPDGRVVSSIGIRGGGRPGRTLELAAEERSAALAASAAQAAERAATTDVKDLQTAVQGADQAAAERAATMQSARIAAAESAVVLDNLSKALATEVSRLASIEAAQRGREEELRAAESRSHVLQSEATAAAATLQNAQELSSLAQSASAEQRTAVEHLATAVRDAEAAAVQARLMSDDVERRIAMARQAADGARIRLEHAELRLLGTESEAMAAWVRRRSAALVANGVGGDVAVALAMVEAAAPDLAFAERALAAIEVERSEIAIAVARATDEQTAAEAEVAVAQARVDELADAVRGDDDDEGPEPDAQAAERAEREIVRLERRVSSLGPVNGLAPEQHVVLAQRVETLRSGRDDIGDASADVRAMVSQLGEEIERRFDAVFGAVCVHFQELFEELFPGGKATLRLEEIAPPPPSDETAETDADDATSPAAARRAPRLPGVEILAQPAGKRLQPLSLLSGGERALTALAVILALQQVNASPFYVFDEIDAPLDDANVIRLTRLLKRLAVEQQFIVVTHNHVTMAAADVLYGVTIDGEGVSSVLSVRLAAAEELAEVDVVGHREAGAASPAAVASPVG